MRVSIKSYLNIGNLFFVAGLLTTAILGFLLPAANGQINTTGQWLVDYRPGLDHARLELRQENARGGYWNNSFEIELGQLRGLNQSQAMSGGAVVQFQLVRDAGTLNCEGWFKDGKGAGHFTYAANPNFVNELRRRGYESPTEEQQFSMTVHDVSLKFIDELKSQGYEQPTLDVLVKTGTHGVGFDYLHELGSMGFKLK